MAKNLPASAGDIRDWVEPLEKKWQPTPVFFSGKAQGQSSLVGYSPWGSQRVGHNLVIKQKQQKDSTFGYRL